MSEQKTQPKRRFPKEYKVNPDTLAVGRYGTLEMVEIWGPIKTFEYSLKVQGQAALTLSRLHPDIVPPVHANEIAEKANLTYIDADRIRELEEKTGHDVIAINTSLEEVVSKEAGTHINKAKTSADTTQPAKALQLKQSLEVIADSVENLRDILLEKSVEWANIPHMDTTHLYDALPTVVGRPLAYYAEMLQSGLNFLKFIYTNSIIGKWADATGNHHSATALGIDGIKLQEAYCDDLKIAFMDAPAQVPGLEFEADIMYSLARLSETINTVAKYFAQGRGDDVNVFINAEPQRKKGSSGMPHKDAKNGNPTAEEQFMSIDNLMSGLMGTALRNCDMPYARNLSGSSNTRIIFDIGFKFLDHGIRNLANRIYWIDVNEEREIERVERSYGVVTSQRVMTYLTDIRTVQNPMTRSEAHDLMGKLATKAYESKTQFIDVLIGNEEVTSRISKEKLAELADPKTYIGESKKVIQTVYDKCHAIKTLT